MRAIPALMLFVALSTRLACAQAPGLLWTNNVGATVFAIDSQTNVYTSVGGTVIKLTAQGVPIQTNSICPLGNKAHRDDAGNLYFGGSFDGTQDFGGITLVGGWTNNFPNPWTPGYPTCFIAKYGSAGNLIWVVSFGRQAFNNSLKDFEVGANGDVYAGFLSYQTGAMAGIDGNGTLRWMELLESEPTLSFGIKVGGVTASNCWYFLFSPFAPSCARMDSGGTKHSMSGVALAWRSGDDTAAEPVIDDQGRVFQVGKCYFGCSDPGDQLLRKYDTAGSVVWDHVIPVELNCTLARDAQANVYVSGTNGLLVKFDTDGSLIWSNNYGQRCINMVVDAPGNRFVSFADGSIARLQSEPSSVSPVIFLRADRPGEGYVPEGFRVTLLSDPGVICQILASTNFTAWDGLGTVTNISGEVQFTDTNAPHFRSRFYKAAP